jgi:hypothetical protein
MVFEQIEKLKQDYTDKYVAVDASRPELARFKDTVGQVKTVNMSGRALVQFQGADIGWYDIELDFLKVVDKPAEKLAQAKAKPTPKKAPAAEQPEKSALEKARAQGPAKKEPVAAGEKKKLSTADILAAARAKKGAVAEAAEAKATAESKKMSTADILAAARTQKKEDGAMAEEKPAPAAGTPKSSTADVLAAARGQGAPKQASEPAADISTAKAAQDPQAEAHAEAEEAEQPESAEAGDPTATVEAGELPTTTAEIMAYCRRVDGAG